MVETGERVTVLPVWRVPVWRECGEAKKRVPRAGPEPSGTTIHPSPFGQIARSIPFNSSYLRGNLGYDPWLLAPNTKLVLDSVGNNET